MSEELNQAGIFRGAIKEYGLTESESGATAVSLVAAIHDIWDAPTKQWCDWRGYDLTVRGDVWIVKKDGTANQSALESLATCLDFTDMTSVADETWRPGQCSFTVEEDKYKDKTRYRISWLHDYDREPGGVGNVSVEKAKALQTKYGSQIRAILGNVKRQQATPPAAPPVPPPAPAKKAAAQAMIPDAQAKDDIPF